MPGKKPVIRIESFGRYSKWEKGSKKLPVILEFTDRIEAFEGNEFGMILRIIGGRGLKLGYCIKHPAFKDSTGKVEPDFTGEYYVNSNDFHFYIGDCIWLPVEDKAGKWTVIVEHDNKAIASKSFQIVLPKEKKDE